MITETADGGFALLVNHTDTTILRSYAGIIRTDADGKVIWRRRYDTSVGFPEAFVKTPDGGFTFAGRISDWRISQMRTTVVHVDATGEVSWKKIYGEKPVTFPTALVRSPDGGYLIGGTTARYDDKGREIDHSTKDFYLLKVDSRGELIREKNWGDPGVSESITHLAVKGSNYIVAGYSNPYTAAQTLYLAEMQDVAASVRASGSSDSRRYHFHVYPNPATMSAETRFALDTRSQVDLALFDNLGNEVRSWSAGILEAGQQRVELDVQGIESLPLPTSRHVGERD